MEQEGESLPVYDFLYIDWERVEFWHANLYTGLLTRVETLSETGKAADKGVGGEVQASVPVPGLTLTPGVGFHAKFGGSRYEHEMRREEIDPKYLRPLEVLAEFLERGIKRSLADASVDDVVLIEGALQFFDLDYLKKGLQFLFPALTKVQQSKQAQQSPSLSKSQRKAQEKAEADQAQLTAKTLELLPSGLQIVLTTEQGEKCWGQLERKNLWVNPEEAQTKFGRQLRGRWSSLVILDSPPDPVAGVSTQNVATPDVREALANIADLMRTVVGRPADHYAVTPLMIFRKLQT